MACRICAASSKRDHPAAPRLWRRRTRLGRPPPRDRERSGSPIGCGGLDLRTVRAIPERLQAHRSRQTHPRPRPGSGNGPPPRQPDMTIHNPSEFFPPITTGLPRHPRPDSPRPPATIKASPSKDRKENLSPCPTNSPINRPRSPRSLPVRMRSARRPRLGGASNPAQAPGAPIPRVCI